MSDKLPTKEEILNELDEVVYEIYNGILVDNRSLQRNWIMENAEKVIPNFKEFSDKYIHDLLEEYKKRFDKDKYGEV